MASKSNFDTTNQSPTHRGSHHTLSLKNLKPVHSYRPTIHLEVAEERQKGVFVTYAPDGGYGWVIVLASFLSNFVLDGISLCPGVLQSVVQEASGKIQKFNESLGDDAFSGRPADDQYEISVGMYSLMGSLLLGIQLLVGPMISLLTNRYGFRAIGMAGSITASSGIFLSWAISPYIPNIWVLIVFYGVVAGIGFGMMFQPSIVIVALYFEKRRALATGIAICGSGVGSMVFPPIVNYMSDWAGWQGAFLFQAAITLLSTSFAFFYRPLPTKFVKLSDIPEEHSVDPGETECLPMIRDMLPLWRSPTFILLAVSGGITTLGFFAPFAFVPDKGVKELGMSEKSAVFAVTTIGIANTVGRLVFGYIADRPWVNQLFLSNAALTVGGIATFLCPFMTQEYQLYIYVVVFGFSIAIFAVLRSILLLKFLGMERFNNGFGLALMVMGVTTLVGNPIGGWLKDITGRYDYAFYAAGLYFTTSGVICYPLQLIKNWETKKELRDKHNNVNYSNT